MKRREHNFSPRISSLVSRFTTVKHGNPEPNHESLKVMLDCDLADLYEVKTKVLLQAVKRNIERFPSDFMFRLTRTEYQILRSQFVTSSPPAGPPAGEAGWGGRRYLPYAFTEHGILMLSSVLNSRRAAKVNIQIMRIFARLREMLASHKELKQKVEEMEKQYDHQFKIVFDAIRTILNPPAKKIGRIGFFPLRERDK